MIKTVIFDLGRVIVPFDFDRGFAEMARHSPYPPEELRRRLGETDLVARLEVGRVAPEDFYVQLSGLLLLDTSYREFRRLWSSIFLPGALVPESLLSGLRLNYRLLLLSNTNSIHFEMIRENYPHIRHFDDFVLSHEVGAAKPSPEIYRAAIARAGCRPEEIFFTDDILSYVEAARREGIDAVQFQSLPQLEADLRARGVQW